MTIATRAPATEPDSFHQAAPAELAGREMVAGSSAQTELAIEALSHSFGDLRVLAGLSLRVAAREVVGLVGPSGCGKTTLLELIAGLRQPDAGRIEVGGSGEPAERLRRCAYMPQRDLLLPWLSALDNAGLALRVEGIVKAEARAAAAPLFERFGLGGFEHSRPHELSGGMRQRVAFLRTLLAGRPLLLLDEPFGALDAITRGEMQEWLAGALAAEPRTVLLVTHDVEEALYLCDRVAVLSSRPAQVLTELRSPAPRAPHRAQVITTREFAELRESALEALR